MFLDEELLKIGRNTDINNWEEINKSVSEIIKKCFDSLSENISPKSSDKDILSQFKRVNNTWRSVAKKLEKENKGILKIDGFRLYVEQKTAFKNIFFN